MTDNQKTFWAGVRAELPLLIGVAPFGMIYGVLAINAGLTPVPAQLMSSIVFAGSAQFITAQLVGEAVPGLVIVLTIAVVNLRHMLYSASVAPYVRALPMRWKVLLSYLLTDEAYAVTILNYERDDSNPSGHWFFLGAGLTLWTSWQISTAIGILLGATMPESWPLDFALPITFIAIVIPALKDRPAIAASLTAGVAALLAYDLPYKLGLIVAGLLGIAVGTFLEGRKSPGGLREYLAGFLAGRVVDLWDAVYLHLSAGQVRGPGDDAARIKVRPPSHIDRYRRAGVVHPLRSHGCLTEQFPPVSRCGGCSVGLADEKYPPDHRGGHVGAAVVGVHFLVNKIKQKAPAQSAGAFCF